MRSGRAAGASPTASATAAPAPTVSAKLAFVDDTTITTYLGDSITWYRRQRAEAQLVDQPEEVLFFATDQQIAKQVLDLAFAAARGQVALNAKASLSVEEQLAANRSPLLHNLQARGGETSEKLAQTEKRIKDLQTQLAAASKAKRAAIAAAITNATAEAELERVRLDAIKSMLQYTAGLAAADQRSNGISAQIDQLQQAVSSTEKNDKSPLLLADAAAKKLEQESNGILGLTSVYFELRADGRTLRDSADAASELTAKIEQFKAPALSLLIAINKRASELAAMAAAGDISQIGDRTREYQRLIQLQELAVGVATPLNKQEVQLSLYQENVRRWQVSVDRYSNHLLQKLFIRLATLFSLLALVIAGKYAWGRLTNRYIADQRRRRQLQQFSEPVFWVLMVFIVIISFATELGSVATIMGFAAAGIALALQNVILSVAGYFFLIGKFGIRVGDRVQIGNTMGDVISIGLVKLSMMELGPQDRQPTGRVVVYSNAVVFQPNGNFFKQAPGMSFVWNEIRLTLAPDCDYRLAEKRVVDAIDEVFSRYRDRVQRDFRYLEADLHVALETPRPVSRLQLTSAGLDMIVRYPADVRTAAQIADEVSRRVLDAIKREQGLQLVSPSPANIQPSSLPPDGVAAEGDEPVAANGGQLPAQKQ